MGWKWEEKSSELVVTTNPEGCVAQLQLFQGAERWSSSAVRGRMADSELKRSYGSEAAQRVCVWRCSTVWPVSREGSLSESLCSFFPPHFSGITSEPDDSQNLSSIAKDEKMTSERTTSEDVFLCLVRWPGRPHWPLSLIKPPPFRLFSWCRGFRHVTEGDRFHSHRTTRVSSSVSCPYLNPQPAFLFCAEVQSQFTQLSAVSDCSKAAWK